MCFLQLAEKRMAPLFKRILQHPFQQDLYAGRLSDETLLRYIEIDVAYLTRQAQALQHLAARSDCLQEAQQLRAVAHYVLNVERKTHLSLRTERRSPAFFDDTTSVRASPHAVNAYITELDMLAKHAPMSVAIGGAAVCFWVFREIGRYHTAEGITSDRQRRWLDSCRGIRFTIHTDIMLNLLAQRALREASLNLSTLDAMERCGEHELALFDAVYPPPSIRAATVREWSSWPTPSNRSTPW